MFRHPACNLEQLALFRFGPTFAGGHGVAKSVTGAQLGVG